MPPNMSCCRLDKLNQKDTINKVCPIMHEAPQIILFVKFVYSEKQVTHVYKLTVNMFMFF